MNGRRRREAAKPRTRGAAAAATSNSNGSTLSDTFSDMLVEPKESFHTIIRRHGYELNEDEHFQGKHSDVIMAAGTPKKDVSAQQQQQHFDLDEISNGGSGSANTNSNNNNHNGDGSSSNSTGESSSAVATNREKGSSSSSSHMLNVAPQIAVKSQYICQPSDILDQSYRELLIYQTLSQLAEEKKSPNFVRLYDWFKSQGDYFDSDSDDESSSEQQQQQQDKPTSGVGSRGKRQKKLKHNQHMNYILEKADLSLSEFIQENNSTLSLGMYKQIMFQIFFSLHMAQEHCEFVHNDLHMKNILLQTLPESMQGCMFVYAGTQWFMDRKNMPFLVKINDFGLSRIKLAETGDVLYNSKFSTHGIFECGRDIEQIAKEFTKVRVNYTGVSPQVEEHERALLTDLRRRMKTHRRSSPSNLMHHEFFDSLIPFCDEKNDLRHDLHPNVLVFNDSNPNLQSHHSHHHKHHYSKANYFSSNVQQAGPSSSAEATTSQQQQQQQQDQQQPSYTLVDVYGDTTAMARPTNVSPQQLYELIHHFEVVKKKRAKLSKKRKQNPNNQQHQQQQQQRKSRRSSATATASSSSDTANNEDNTKDESLHYYSSDHDDVMGANSSDLDNYSTNDELEDDDSSINAANSDDDINSTMGAATGDEAAEDDDEEFDSKSASSAHSKRSTSSNKSRRSATHGSNKNCIIVEAQAPPQFYEELVRDDARKEIEKLNSKNNTATTTPAKSSSSTSDNNQVGSSTGQNSKQRRRLRI